MHTNLPCIGKKIELCKEEYTVQSIHQFQRHYLMLSKQVKKGMNHQFSSNKVTRNTYSQTMVFSYGN